MIKNAIDLIKKGFDWIIGLFIITAPILIPTVLVVGAAVYISSKIPEYENKVVSGVVVDRYLQPRSSPTLYVLVFRSDGCKIVEKYVSPELYYSARIGQRFRFSIKEEVKKD